MNHEMLLGPAIGFLFTVGTIAFVAATAKGMELRYQTTVAADPDAFMFYGENQPPAASAPAADTIAGLAPAGVQPDAAPPVAVAPVADATEAPAPAAQEASVPLASDGPSAPPQA